MQYRIIYFLDVIARPGQVLRINSKEALGRLQEKPKPFQLLAPLLRK